MTTNRVYALFGLIVILGLAGAGVLTSLLSVAHSPSANAGQAVSAPNQIMAEQARLDQRRGEWNAGSENIYAPLDEHDRHQSAPAADAAEQALLDQRRGEWNAGQAPKPAGFDVEQARIQWRASK